MWYVYVWLRGEADAKSRRMHVYVRVHACILRDEADAKSRACMQAHACGCKSACMHAYR